MQQRRDDVQMKTAAAVARARAARATAESRSKVMQMIADQKQKEAAMSPQQRQRMREGIQQSTARAMARLQTTMNERKPANDKVMQAPSRGLTHDARTVGDKPPSRQPRNSTSARDRPIASVVALQRTYLQSNGELRDATAAVLKQHGWSDIPADPQTIVLFREKVDQVVRNKQRSRRSRQRRRMNRAQYRQQDAAAHQQGDY